MLVAYAEQRSRERPLASQRDRRALPRYAKGVASASLPLHWCTGIPFAALELSASSLCLHPARSQLTLRPVREADLTAVLN